MSLVSFSNVSKLFNLDLVLDHVSFQINKGEKIALIGDNGTGKTTILKLMLREIPPSLLPKEDKVGSIEIIRDLKIGYLSQDAIKNIENTVLEELEDAFSYNKRIINEFDEIIKELSDKPNDEKLINKYNKYLALIENENIYNYKYEIETMISKFSFPLDTLNKKIKELSGGERMKIAFIKLLLSKYDLLLLDEPTNHLDISTIEWLENYLKKYEGTILFVSHDRYFLETLADKVLELENSKITTYNTGYNEYLHLKKINYENLLKQQLREEEEMEKYRKFIEFYMPKPRFASRAHDREKKLARLEKEHVVATKKENNNINMSLEGGNLKNKCLLVVNDLTIGYSLDKPLLSNISFEIYGKDKIALIGDNGIGKTTFIKTLLNEISPISGEIKFKRKLDIGYIKQNDHLFNGNGDILSHLKSVYPSKSESELRGALGKFLFKKDEIYKPISVLSNGEKMRINLCSLMLSSYDLLIFDEPTNHLDMVTKECLIKAIKEYEGAILIISHDRYFINQIANYILYFSTNKIGFYEGNYDDNKEEFNSFILEKSIKKETNGKEIKESLIYDPLPKKEKLSNNKINEIKNRLTKIENEINNIDIKLEEDFVDYKMIEELQDKKETLEEEYFELLQKIS